MAEPADKGEAEGAELPGSGVPQARLPVAGAGVALVQGRGAGSCPAAPACWHPPPRPGCPGRLFNSIQLGLPLGSSSPLTAGLTDGIRAACVAHAQAAEPPPAGPGTHVTYGVCSSAPRDLLPGRPCCPLHPPASQPPSCLGSGAEPRQH